MQRDSAYLLDILEAAKVVHVYVSGKTKEDFLRDSLCQDAIIRRLEIIGEAARRVSEQTRESLPDLPWPGMIGMRNRLIHRYDDIDMVVVWDTVCRDMPPLIACLEKIVQPEE